MLSWPVLRVMLVQERSSVMCTPKNLVLLNLFTVAPLLVRGAGRVCTLLKSTTISFVFSTFRRDCCHKHHPARRLTRSPVVCLISVANETHHSRVIRKLNEKVGVVWWCVVVGQQSEEDGAQNTSLGGMWTHPLCSMWWCWMCYCRPILPEVSQSGSPTASCTETCWALAGPIFEWAIEGWLCWMLNWNLWTALGGWRAMAMASSVERLDRYTNWKESREGARTDFMCLKSLIEMPSW